MTLPSRYPAPSKHSNQRWYEKAGPPRDALSSQIGALDQVQEGEPAYEKG
jgi:hypothetical protein